jgi:Phosphoinositide phospholipase C, Ca2+-dependent
MNARNTVLNHSRSPVSRVMASLSPGVLCLCLLFRAAIGFAAEPNALDELPINQLQVVGTHNSYHTREKPTTNPRALEWNYSHAPLDVQLDRGVRSFELDLHYKNGQFEVFHVPLLDEGTTCRDLAAALATVRKWSQTHPRHVPISFLFELKVEGPKLDKRIKHVDAEGLDRLDEVLRAGFSPAQIITPDSVRGTAATLREAVTTAGWPKLADARGKVLFILHDDDQKRALYTEGHRSLRGRAMFVRSDATRDDGATLVLDNPRDPKIGELAKAGYFIRTRADSGLRADPPAQPARRDAALASGAHIVSTDFPSGEADAKTGYVVDFANSAPARVNPISGPESLRGRPVAE